MGQPRWQIAIIQLRFNPTSPLLAPLWKATSLFNNCCCCRCCCCCSCCKSAAIITQSLDAPTQLIKTKPRPVEANLLSNDDNQFHEKMSNSNDTTDLSTNAETNEQRCTGRQTIEIRTKKKEKKREIQRKKFWNWNWKCNKWTQSTESNQIIKVGRVDSFTNDRGRAKLLDNCSQCLSGTREEGEWKVIHQSILNCFILLCKFVVQF